MTSTDYQSILAALPYGKRLPGAIYLLDHRRPRHRQDPPRRTTAAAKLRQLGIRDESIGHGVTKAEWSRSAQDAFNSGTLDGNRSG